MANQIKKKISVFRIIIKTLNLFLILVLFTLIYSFGVALTENILVDREIEAFKSRAVFEYEEEITYAAGVFQTRRYYKVSRETSYELSDTRPVFTDSTRRLLGQKGDVFVTRETPFPYIPVVHQVGSYYFGGHAAIHNGNNRFIEATGFPEDDESIWDIIRHPGNEPHDFSVTVAMSATNYWMNSNFRTSDDPSFEAYGTYYRKRFIVLRAKDVTMDQIDVAVDYARDKVDKALYNFTYFFNTQYKYGCTDLVSRAYQAALVEPERQRSYSRALNDDRFITTINDIILSKDTYMTAYVEVIDDVFHIYYLEDL
jgi:hypothetical protein